MMVNEKLSVQAGIGSVKPRINRCKLIILKQYEYIIKICHLYAVPMTLSWRAGKQFRLNETACYVPITDSD